MTVNTDLPFKATQKQAEIYLELLSHAFQKKEDIKRHNSFTWGGRVFMIDFTIAAQIFVKNNPTGGDFFTWCQQTYTHASSVPFSDKQISVMLAMCANQSLPQWQKHWLEMAKDLIENFNGLEARRDFVRRYVKEINDK